MYLPMFHVEHSDRGVQLRECGWRFGGGQEDLRAGLTQAFDDAALVDQVKLRREVIQPDHRPVTTQTGVQLRLCQEG